MSPLLFLAIAVVVPLLGMLVLGVSARLQRGRETDDETEPFKRRLEAIAPREAEPEVPRSAPGLMDQPRPNDASEDVPADAGAAQDTPAPDAGPPARPSTSVRLVERGYSFPALPPFSAGRDGRRAPRPPTRSGTSGSQRSSRRRPGVSDVRNRSGT